MAIDFRGYKEGFGGQGGLVSGSPMLAQGLSSALGGMPTAAEKLESNQMGYFSKLSNELNPEFQQVDGKLQTTAGTEMGEGLKSLPEAWKEYKGTIGNRIRPNEFALFKEKYDSLVAGSGTNLAQKFTAMTQAGVKNSTIRGYLRDNPQMRNTLVKLGMANPDLLTTLSPYLSGGVGVVPGLMEKSGDLAGAASPLLISGAARGIQGSLGGGGIEGAITGIKKGITPGRVAFERGMDRMGPEGIHKRVSGTGRFTGKGYNWGTKDMKKISLGREDALKKAREKFASAKKSYEFDKKGKKIKGKNFSSTKKAKALKKQITRRQNIVKAGYKPKYVTEKTTKLAAKGIKSYIKTHGRGKLLKEMARRIGPRGALKLIGKLGLGLVGKASGIGAGVGLAFDALAVYQVSNIVKDIISEESGGIRRPDKMLFGGSTNLEGQKF